MNAITSPRAYSPSDEKIAEMVDRIVRQFDPLKIILFGSCARGTATAESDVDLYVVLESTPDKRASAVEIMVALADVLAPKDIFVTTPPDMQQKAGLTHTVLSTALREGTVLYERPTE